MQSSSLGIVKDHLEGSLTVIGDLDQKKSVAAF